MTREYADRLAKELANRYERTVYVHLDPVLDYNLRFDSPIESVIQSPEYKTVITRKPLGQSDKPAHQATVLP